MDNPVCIVPNCKPLQLQSFDFGRILAQPYSHNIMLLSAIGDVYKPTAGDIALMLLSAALFFVIFFWRRLAPGAWRSKLVKDNIKKAWFLMTSHEEKVAFAKLIIEAAKSDGKVTGEENEAIFEEITLDHKKAAQQMTEDEMFGVLRRLPTDRKEAVLQAMQTLLNSDGDFAPSEAEWLAMVTKQIAVTPS